jgi:Lon protease-like protein
LELAVSAADDIKRLALLLPRSRGERTAELTRASLFTAIDTLQSERDALLEELRWLSRRDRLGLYEHERIGAAIKKCEEPK